MNKFGELVYQLRKSKSMTQAELAALLGITDKAVSRWENGETFPETAQLVPLASIFNLSVDELLKGERIKECQSDIVSEMAIKLANSKKEKYDKSISKAVKILSIIAIVSSILYYSLLPDNCFSKSINIKSNRIRQ